MKRMNLLTQIVIATILGVLVGIFLGESVGFLSIIGTIFLRLIQMSIVLLVMGQIIEAVGELNPRTLGSVGVKTFVIFFVSSVSAAALGVVMGLLFRPGTGIDSTAISPEGVDIAEGVGGSIGDTILSFFPSNVMQALSEGNIVHVIVFSVLFGLAMSYVRTDSGDNTVLDFVKRFNVIILRLIGMIMVIAPIGIFALIASTISNMGVQVVLPLLKYLGVYALATLIYLVLWFVGSAVYTRVSVFQLTKNMTQMAIMALVTTSSAVTLPTALKDAKEKLGIHDRIAKLVLPLGMTLNSNGSAMHMAITIVTIAQIYGVQYGTGDYVYIAFLAALASLANAVVPGAGLVSLAIVVPQMNLPIESIALFAGVEWFVGMLRTVLNVSADATTAFIVAKSEDAVDLEVFNRR
ncbi:dicarboxylate/amino acid:cation symporter [Jeotgalibaca caeni]|uniref:dicarboxylate/amino acid:cation symporter n=1 Tax=Jeotgalibaca caeni TaxID=3028623 RepID=UPI00237E726E|nr:dicarboxylate/amino acid:cation symporter [Jeotgalibaca caeni]MDE1547649.1 dicarboxylate/amino acid:cation symporter [Jeotgalibaca caeni]